MSDWRATATARASSPAPMDATPGQASNAEGIRHDNHEHVQQLMKPTAACTSGPRKPAT